MFDVAVLLEAVRAQPDDPGPRLILADYLEANDQTTRAEFIRLQCEIDDCPPDSPDLQELRHREHLLLRDNRVAWWNELPDLPGVQWENFEKGFVSTVRFQDFEAFQTHAQTVFQVAPILHIRFQKVFAMQVSRLLDQPGMQYIQTLDFENGNRLANAGAQAIAQAENLSALRVLNLRSNQLGPSAVRSLVRSPHLPNLEELILDWNDLFEDAAEAFRDPAVNKPFRKLSFGQAGLGDAGVRYLAESPCLEQLEWLYLSGNRLTDAGAESLGASPYLGNLKSLYLDQNQIGDRGLAALASGACARSLQFFYLKHNRFGEAGTQALLDSQHLTQIQELVLLENGLNRQTIVERLRERFQANVWV